MTYFDDPSYNLFLRMNSVAKNVSNSFSFGDFYYKGLIIPDSTCQDWQNYFGSQLVVPVPGLIFNSLVLDFHRHDFALHKVVNVTYTCSSPDVIGKVISSLKNRVTYEGNCNEQTWRVFVCDSNPVLCVNCKRNCVKTVSCPAKSFIVNPCATNCQNHAASFALMTMGYYLKPLYPLLNETVVTSVGRTSVSLLMNISSPGKLYCAAFRQNTSLPSTFDIRASATELVVERAGYLNYTINSLAADSNYDAYCYTEDFSKHMMPIGTIMQNKLSFRTSCCRQLLASTSNPTSIVQYIPSSSISEQVFRMSLDSKPYSSVVMKLSYLPVVCSGSMVVASNPDVVLLPSSFQFYANSTSLTAEFVARGTVVGCYNVKATVAGNWYYSSTNFTFGIRNVRTAPSVPNIVSVIFSSDGTALWFSFDSPTDRGSSAIGDFASQFNCSKIASFSGSGKSMCRWFNNTAMIASLPNGNSGKLPSVGDIVTMKGNIVKAQCVSGTNCNTYGAVKVTTLVLLRPSSPLLPIVTVVAPNVMTRCEDMILDPTPSTGFGSRNWVSVQWQVSGTITIGNKTIIENYLNSKFSANTNGLVTIPNMYLSGGRTYTFTLTLTNFLLGKSSWSFDVATSKSWKPIPVVQLSGALDIYYPSKPVNLLAAVTIPTCLSGNVNNITLTYTWKVFQGVNFLSSIQTTSVDRRYFKTPSYTFQPSNQYIVQIIVGISGTSITNSASTILAFGSEGVTASIAGSSSRTVSNSASLILDGLSSVNDDYPSDGLLYSWSCKMISGSYGSACKGFPTATTNAILIISANSMAVGQFSIRLTVSNPAQTASHFTDVAITLMSATLPLISIATVQSKYNSKDKIILSSSITGSTGNNVLAVWSTDSSITLSNITTTPLAQLSPPGTFAFALALKPGSLTAGLSYSFKLTVSYAVNGSSAAASAAVTILANAPPIGGTIAVAPLIGQALSTLYTLISSQWFDDPNDYPLTVAFYYQITSSAQAKVLKDFDPSTNYVTTLAQGLSSTSYQIICIVNVADIYFAQGSATTTTIAQSPRTTTAAITLAGNRLSTALRLQNPTSINQNLNVALTTINTVDCNTPVSCALINRQPCTTTARTCGECSSAFIGVSGASNLPCNSSTSIVPDGGVCMFNATCASGLCVRNRCHSVSKSCPGSCMSQGKCTLYDAENSVISFCNINDATCSARCVCNSGNYGRDCSLTQSTFTQLVSFRETVCSALVNASSIQDVTDYSVINTRVNIIVDTFVDIEQLSQSAISHCAKVLISTVTNYPTLACSPAAYTQVMNAFGSLIGIGNRLSSDMFQSIDNAMLALVQGCVHSLVVGEVPTAIISGNIRMNSVQTDVNLLPNLVFTSPQTALEALNHIPTASVRMNLSLINPSTASNSLMLFTRQYTNNPQRLISNSSGLTISIQIPANKKSSTSRRLATTADVNTNYTFTLQNSVSINYHDLLPAIKTIYCKRLSSMSYSMNVSCPGGERFTMMCPANSRGHFNVTCPGYKMLPVCSSRNSPQSNFVVDSSCVVIEYDSKSTTCSCQQASSSLSSTFDIPNSRRSLQSSSSQVEFSTSYIVERSHMANIFLADESTLKVTTSDITLSALYALVLCFACGSFLFGYIDFQYHRKEQRKMNDIVNKSNLTVSQRVVAAMTLTTSYVVNSQGIPYRSVEQFFNSMFPLELRASKSSWNKFWYYLEADHTWLRLYPFVRFVPKSLLTPNPVSTNAVSSVGTSTVPMSTKSYTLHWLVLISKLLSMVFFVTALLLFLFPDNTDCNQYYDDQASCEAQKIFSNALSACSWVSSNHTCVYNRPYSSAILLIVLVTIAVFFTIVTTHLCQFFGEVVWKLWKYSLPSKQQVIPLMGTSIRSNKLALLPNTIDEFGHNIPKKTTLLRAIRLEKTKQSMDYLLPHEETTMLSQQLGQQFTDFQNHAFHFSQLSETLFLQHARYPIKYPINSNSLIPKVNEARKNTIRLRQYFESYYLIKNYYETPIIQEKQEQFLWKNFIQFLFQEKRKVVFHLISSTFQKQIQLSDEKEFIVTDMWRYYLLKTLLCVVLGVWVGIMLFFVAFLVTYATSLGDRSNELWYSVIVISFLEDCFLCEPCLVALRMGVQEYFAADLRHLYELLMQKSKIVLLRKNGLMKHSNDLLQHFNPICRLARMYPYLPISRLLLSLNDNDIPLLPYVHFRWYNHIAEYIMTSLAYLMYFVPGSLGNICLGVLLLFSLNGAAVGLFFLWEWDWIIMIAVCGFFVLLLLGYALYGGYLARTEKKLQAELLNAKIFEDPIDETDHQITMSGGNMSTGFGGNSLHSMSLWNNKDNVSVAPSTFSGGVNQSFYSAHQQPPQNQLKTVPSHQKKLKIFEESLEENDLHWSDVFSLPWHIRKKRDEEHMLDMHTVTAKGLDINSPGGNSLHEKSVQDEHFYGDLTLGDNDDDDLATFLEFEKKLKPSSASVMSLPSLLSASRKYLAPNTPLAANGTLASNSFPLSAMPSNTTIHTGGNSPQMTRDLTVPSIFNPSSRTLFVPNQIAAQKRILQGADDVEFLRIEGPPLQFNTQTHMIGAPVDSQFPPLSPINEHSMSQTLAQAELEARRGEMKESLEHDELFQRFEQARTQYFDKIQRSPSPSPGLNKTTSRTANSNKAVVTHATGPSRRARRRGRNNDNSVRSGLSTGESASWAGPGPRSVSSHGFDEVSLLSELESLPGQASLRSGKSSQFQYRKYAGRLRKRSGATPHYTETGHSAPGGEKVVEAQQYAQLRSQQALGLLQLPADKALPVVDIFSANNSVYSASSRAEPSVMSLAQGPGSVLYEDKFGDFGHHRFPMLQ